MSNNCNPRVSAIQLINVALTMSKDVHICTLMAPAASIHMFTLRCRAAKD